MSIMLAQIFKIPPLDLTFLWFFVGPFAFAIVLWTLFFFQEKRRVKEGKPPQTDKLLRPAGYSLGIRIDEAFTDLVNMLITGALMWGLGAGLGQYTIQVLAAPVPAIWGVAFGVVSLYCLVRGVFLTKIILQKMREIQNLKLGMRGEQAVAEVLHEVAEQGYRSFHDLQGGEDWNIDHVAVGSKGVFLIETKARRRRGARSNQPSHVVRVDDKGLHFPRGDDQKAIPQAEQNGRWLANYLTKKTGEGVEVEALVVLPGWFVENLNAKSARVKVMNTTYLTGFLARQPERLPAAQVRRIIAALDEKCRDLEF
jgi:hypothetical protein